MLFIIFATADYLSEVNCALIAIAHTRFVLTWPSSRASESREFEFERWRRGRSDRGQASAKKRGSQEDEAAATDALRSEECSSASALVTNGHLNNISER